MSRERRSGCPIAFTLDIIGDRWSLIILRDLLLKDKKLYNEFAESKEKISTNILADRIELLKRSGLITSRQSKENKRNIIYAPTEKALDLIPAILEIIEWGANYDPESDAPKELVRQIKSDRKALALRIRAKFKK
jgi:DNA-binding HxlR family transcriptional regulator